MFTISMLIEDSWSRLCGIWTTLLFSGLHSVHSFASFNNGVATTKTLFSKSSTKQATLTPFPPLEVKFPPPEGGGKINVLSVMPDGFKIVDNSQYGRKIVASKSFEAGETLYRGYAALICDDQVDHQLVVYNYSKDDYRLVGKYDNDDTHSVHDYNSDENGATNNNKRRRQVFGWDSFMNHSCEPNTYFRLVRRTENVEICYEAIAVRGIEKGDEVTCDYACFDYSCDGHPIEKCQCGSLKFCRGKMVGFSGIESLQDKVKILHMCEKEIVDAFFKEEGKADDRGGGRVELLYSNLPEGIRLVTTTPNGGYNHHLEATRSFQAGEKIFTNYATIKYLTEIANKRYVLKCNDRYILLDNVHHTIGRPGGYVEFLGFDSFMDHSCSPNTRQTYCNKTEYNVFAKRDIHPGEKITCDYSLLNNDAENLDIVPFTSASSFVCNCGAKNCKGLLVAA